MTADRRPGYDDTIQDVQRMVVQTRMAYYDQLTHRETITKELHRELASRVLQYADVLRVFRDRIDDFPDVSGVKQRLGEQTEVVTASPRLGEKRTTRTVPSVVEIPAGRLVRMTNELDAVAQQLGFGADADVEPPDGPHGDAR